MLRLFSLPLRFIIVLSVGGLSVGTVAADEAPPAAADGWDLLAQFLYRDAAEAFAKDQTGGRLRDLGLAAAMLNEPPVTAGKIEHASAILREVVAGGADDPSGLYAQYLLVRIMHDHAEQPLAKVEAAYRAIVTAAPQSVAAQLSAAQLALLTLYQRPDLAVPDRIAEAAKLASVAGNTQLPDVAASYYQLLANASMFYRLTNEQVVGWLEHACAIGMSNQLDQSTLTLQVAEASRAIGQSEKAITYYQRFLATAAPTDQRYYTAELRMNELKKEAAK